MTVFRGLLIMLTGGEVITELPAAFGQLANVRVAGLTGSILVMLAVILVVHIWLRHLVAGRHLYARERVPRRRGLVGICAGEFGWPPLVAVAPGGSGRRAGTLRNGSMQAVMGTGYELRAIAAAVIGGAAIAGGRGNTAGVVLGALLLSLVHNSLVLWQISRYHYGLVVGGLILAAVLWDLAWKSLATESRVVVRLGGTARSLAALGVGAGRDRRIGSAVGGVVVLARLVRNRGPGPGATPIILTGGIDLSVGSVVALAGVVLATLRRDYDWPIWAAAAAAIATGALAGGGSMGH